MPVLNVEGLKIHYLQKGEGPDLVFIHGLGSSTTGWEFQEGLASNYRMLTYDVRGHGKSDKPPGPYSVQLFAKDLARLLKTLGIKNANIVGISMGGWIAFQFAVDHPNMVNTLTIINSWADMIPKTWGEKFSVFRRLVIFKLFSMRKIGEILSKGLFIKPEQEEIRNAFVEEWAKNDKPSYMASMRGAIGWSVVDHLEEIKCPVLVVAADKDYSPLKTKEEYANRLPNARLEVIEDSRHATPVEKPEEFNRVLAKFLAENN